MRPRETAHTARQLSAALSLNIKLAHLLVLAAGLALVLASFLGKASSRLSVVFLSVGASVIAAGLVGLLLGFYTLEQRLRDDEVRHWQLAGIYTTRADMNRSTNARLSASRGQIDIAAFGLKGFRESQSTLVEEKVRLGMQVRILCLKPDSPFVVARELSEGEVSGQIRKTIVDLAQWVGELRQVARHPEQVSLKYYDALPLDFFFRVDDAIYIGPYLHGYSSQQTISLEFTRPGVGFDYWRDYFDNLWDDESFSKPAFVVEVST